jgi:cytochrome c biogenesis protein
MTKSKQNRERSSNTLSSVSRFLQRFGSVRIGIYLLIALGALSLVGMLLAQQDAAGAPAFLAQLGPSGRSVFAWLGLLDVFHAWYFRVLLVALSLNIILSSIEQFPSTWRLVRDPNVTMAPTRFEAQKHFKDYFLFTGDVDSAAAAVKERLAKHGFKDIRMESAGGARFVFGQKGAWNTFGVYAVHASLLLILFGGFLTSWLAKGGEMTVGPGTRSREITARKVSPGQGDRSAIELPFEVYCRDIRQKLINSKGSIRASNTLDWITEISVIDGNTKTDAKVSVNAPFDYKGYRIFHSSVVPLGRARNLTLEATPESGSEETVTMDRGGVARLKDGTTLRFVDFRAGYDLESESPVEDTSDYESPAAFLEIAAPDGTRQTAIAFGGSMAEMQIAKNPVAGYTFRIKDFERVADRHILLIRRDPGQPFLYAGFWLLVFSLLGVFLFSHKRIWFRADGEAAGIRVRIAGETNRPYDTLPALFEKFSAEVYEDLYED